MENGSKAYMLAAVALLFLFPAAHGWGTDGHLIACRIAQSRLSSAAADAVNELLPAYAKGNLSSLCSWADNVRFRFQWSAPLHFINTPDVCNYQYKSEPLMMIMQLILEMMTRDNVWCARRGLQGWRWRSGQMRGRGYQQLHQPACKLC